MTCHEYKSPRNKTMLDTLTRMEIKEARESSPVKCQILIAAPKYEIASIPRSNNTSAFINICLRKFVMRGSRRNSDLVNLKE